VKGIGRSAGAAASVRFRRRRRAVRAPRVGSRARAVGFCARRTTFSALQI